MRRGNPRAVIVPTATAPAGGGAPGEEIAHAERVTNDTTQSTNAANGHLNRIPGLAITVVGTGRPVQVEFFCNIKHSVVNNGVGMIFVVNGALILDDTQLAQSSTPIIAQSRSLYCTKRFVIPEGEEWTIEVGKWISGAGTGTYEGSDAAPITLTATQR